MLTRNVVYLYMMQKVKIFEGIVYSFGRLHIPAVQCNIIILYISYMYRNYMAPLNVRVFWSLTMTDFVFTYETIYLYLLYYNVPFACNLSWTNYIALCRGRTRVKSSCALQHHQSCMYRRYCLLSSTIILYIIQPVQLYIYFIHAYIHIYGTRYRYTQYNECIIKMYSLLFYTEIAR